MHKILITGNGFDLHHNLPTAYNDFIEVLKNLERLSNLDNITFDIIFNGVCDDLPADKKSKVSFDSKRIEELKIKLSDNKWYDYFKNIKSDMTWIDFENTIEDVLKKIVYFLDVHSKICPEGYHHYQHNNKLNDFLYSSQIVFHILSKFKIIIYEAQVLKSVIYDDFGDVVDNILEEGYTISDELVNIYNKELKILSVEKISTLLLLELDNFRSIFNEYFMCFVVPLYDSIQFKLNESIKRNIDYHYTFNYTPTFERVYKINKTEYIHGKIGDPFNLVLGINKTPSNVSYKKHFIPFTKLFQKLNYSTDYNFLLNNVINYKLSNSSVFIFIWGHSLDPSDSEYIHEIFKVCENNNNKVIVILKEEASKSKLLMNLINILGGEKTSFLMRSNSLEFVLNNSDRLDLLLNKTQITDKID